ncbi:MAG: restriction endonuclease subunit S, partial [Candidatus Saccharibacteria bacterium]|nr:restriction endonuclease subunit S [Candidatus Saccharibacteria bacterium]
FTIPSNWKWVRLGDVVSIHIVKTPSRNDQSYWRNGEYPWVSIADLRNGDHISETKEMISGAALDKCFGGSLAKKGSLLYSFKLTIGKMSIIDMDAAHNEAIAELRTDNNTLRSYLFKTLPALDFAVNSSNAIKGKTLNSKTLSCSIFPLPPLAEQKRIVEAVDKLFGLLDQIADNNGAAEKLRSQLTATCLSIMAQGDNIARSIAMDNLPELIRAHADAQALRQSILQLAVSGQLLPQDPADGNADDLYQQIQDEKQRLISEGKLKKQKPLPPINPDEVPFTIPSNWKWVRLGELFDVTSSKRILQSQWQDDGVPFLRARDLSRAAKTSRISSDIFISNKLYDELKEITGVPQPNDIMVSGVGTIGVPYVVLNDDEFYFKDATILWFRNTYNLDAHYVKIVMDSPYMVNLIRGQSQGTTVDTFTIGNARMEYYPLPPLREQKRIVEVVDKLFAIINHLDQNLL